MKKFMILALLMASHAFCSSNDSNYNSKYNCRRTYAELGETLTYKHEDWRDIVREEIAQCASTCLDFEHPNYEGYLNNFNRYAEKALYEINKNNIRHTDSFLNEVELEFENIFRATYEWFKEFEDAIKYSHKLEN